ncbi:MAG: hypothetical protein FJ214_08925 [Ignavibacteria bacterium]|nr:hypothetical protein [Ignavibacteria bacterium]
MKNLSEYIGQELILTQPKFLKREYELNFGEEQLMKINVAGFFGNSVLIETSIGNWEIYKESIWRAGYSIRLKGRELPFAKYVKDKFKSSGTIELPRGQKLKIESNIWKGTYQLKNQAGTILTTFNNKISFKEKMIIKIENRSELLDTHPWLLILIWFIALQRKQRAAAS